MLILCNRSLKLCKSGTGRWLRLFSNSSETSSKKSLIPSAIVNSSPTAEKELYPLRLALEEQKSMVKKLKEAKAPMEDLCYAIDELKVKQKSLEKMELELCPPIVKVDKAQLDILIKRRFLYDQSFSIYGGAQGLYDFGPAGCAVKNKIIQEWRQFFVLTDNMLEIDCPVLTPEPVLQASGHLDRFTDYLVSDSVTGVSYRADHLVRQTLELMALEKNDAEAEKALKTVDSLDASGLQSLIDRFQIKAPNTGNKLTVPRKFNLMFETSAGDNKVKGQAQRNRLFLRPETAQGVFTNFNRLLAFNHGRLPMAVAQVGPSYRNEIQPKSGLIRLREFFLAEIEHFYDPEDCRHPDFHSVANLSLPLLSAADQSLADSSAPRKPIWRQLGASVASGLVANETVGYYLGRIFLFLTNRCGIDYRRLRFRQHPPGERAHYAADCWDAEVLLAAGAGSGEEYVWVECVGCADRSAYDLTRHSEASSEKLEAARPRSASATASKFTPSVVEPSFGLGRLLAASIEHNFRFRPGSDQQRSYLKLPPWLAPYQCALLITNARSQEMRRLVRRLSRLLASEGVANLVDADSQGVSIGKRYSRTDQLGVPFAVTIDQVSVLEAEAASLDSSTDLEKDWLAGCEQPTVTLRERDSMAQVRVKIGRVPELVKQLVQQRITWAQVMESEQVVK